MKVTMFVKNSFKFDARVTRAAKKLIEEGNEVTVIALYDRGQHTHETTPDGIKVIRVYRYPFGGDFILRLLGRRRVPGYEQPEDTNNTSTNNEPVIEVEDYQEDPASTSSNNQTEVPNFHPNQPEESQTENSDTADSQEDLSSTSSNQIEVPITPPVQPEEMETENSDTVTDPNRDIPSPETTPSRFEAFPVLAFLAKVLRFALYLARVTLRRSKRLARKSYRLIRNTVKKAWRKSKRLARKTLRLMRKAWRKSKRLARKTLRLMRKAWRKSKRLARKTLRFVWRKIKRLLSSIWQGIMWGVMKLLRFQGRAIRTYAINRRMIKEGLASEADIYHAHDVNTLWIATQCKKKTGKPLIYDTHEFATGRNQMTWWWRQRELWNERRGLAHTDGLIVVTPDWIPMLETLYGPMPPWATVTNVPEKREITTQDLRGELGIENGHPILIYQGTIQENRGIEPAIDAVQQLNGVVLVVIGFGHYRPRLEELVKYKGIDDKVKFFGPIPHPQLLDWASAGDIGMCNIVNSSVSYYTTLPNKLFEYFAAGLAVIGSDSPGVGEIITRTGAGITVDPLSGSEIASATRKILEDPEPFKQAAMAASERYNWDIESQKMLELYRTVTQRAGISFP